MGQKLLIYGHGTPARGSCTVRYDDAPMRSTYAVRFAAGLVVSYALVLAVAAAAAAPTPRSELPPATTAPALDSAARVALARRHAPEMRFNARLDAAAPIDRSPQNRDEMYFPMSAERFFAEYRPQFDDRRITSYPERLKGDPPGAAPIYADVYPDGVDPAIYFAEYWSFYPYDECPARVASVFGPIGSHRADWEHVTLKLRLDGTGRSEIVAAVYYGHEHALLVEPELLELVEGAHPVVYVAAGKHASYPEPGEWRNYTGLAPIVQFDDVFHGNGPRARTWEGEIVDISRATRAPERRYWLEYEGRWGPEDARFLGFPVAASSRGPWAHRESNDRLSTVTGTWTGAKAASRGLRVDRDRGR